MTKGHVVQKILLRHPKMEEESCTITLNQALLMMEMWSEERDSSKRVGCQLKPSSLEEKIEHFIKCNRKICWEAEFEQGQFCVGENRLRKFVSDLKRGNNG